MADTLTRAAPAVEGANFVDNVSAEKSGDQGFSKFSLRALISSKEAGVVIGKGGAHIASLRSNFNVGAGVSKHVGELTPRILTISGSLEAVSSSYEQVASSITMETPVGDENSPSGNSNCSIHLLVDHHQMGSIIGRGGAKIEAIQKAAKVHMVAKREMLPGSTERVVEIQGSPENIKAAILEIGQCLISDTQMKPSDRSTLYDPSRRSTHEVRSPRRNGADYSTRTGNGADFTNSDEGEVTTQNISIPSDMVGCIIGKQGSKIKEIRKKSNARISIAQGPHDETGERMFTITGSAGCVEQALYLLYESLEAEKYRRSEGPATTGAQGME